jgi:hypothetical protein
MLGGLSSLKNLPNLVPGKRRQITAEGQNRHQANWRNVMRIGYFRVIAPVAVVGMLAGAAYGANLFSTEEQAKQVCANDSVVWVDINHNRYYHASSAKYGKGDGGFTCERTTRAQGYEPAKE